MIKNFMDKDNKCYDILMRGRYQSNIKSSKKLKELIDNSINYEGLKKLHPSYNNELILALKNSYEKKTYREVMSLFGIISGAWYKGLKR